MYLLRLSRSWFIWCPHVLIAPFFDLLFNRPSLLFKKKIKLISYFISKIINQQLPKLLQLLSLHLKAEGLQNFNLGITEGTNHLLGLCLQQNAFRITEVAFALVTFRANERIAPKAVQPTKRRIADYSELSRLTQISIRVTLRNPLKSAIQNVLQATP